MTFVFNCLRLMAQNSSDVPAEFVFERLLSIHAIALGPLPQEKYKTYFAQFSVSAAESLL